MPVNNGWDEWGRHVLAELERLNRSVDDLSSKLEDTNKKLVALSTEFKVKAGLIGALVIILSAAASVAIKIL